MLHIVCLTKSYNKLDFELWYKYYNSLDACIHIIDNESTIDIKSILGHKHTYELISGWPDQWNLFNKILSQNPYGFKYGDYVIFVDDDEYFWFKDNNWELSIENEFNQTPLNLLCVPQIYISSKNLKEQRSEPYIYCNYYIRNDYSSQGKAIIFYDPALKYSYNHGTLEIGHIPWVKYPNDHEWMRMAKVIGSDITRNSTYGIVDYNANIRLYHYHLKSLDDWNKKWARGSAACTAHPYSENIKNNAGYGEYNTLDLTIKNLNI